MTEQRRRGPPRRGFLAQLEARGKARSTKAKRKGKTTRIAASTVRTFKS